MNTYIKCNGNNEVFAVRASRAQLSKCRDFQARFSFVPATKSLRDKAKRNIEVKTLRITPDGTLGHL